jgi:hypothetical protein
LAALNGYYRGAESRERVEVVRQNGKALTRTVGAMISV